MVQFCIEGFVASVTHIAVIHNYVIIFTLQTLVKLVVATVIFLNELFNPQYQHVHSPYSSYIFHMLHVGRICINVNSTDPSYQLIPLITIIYSYNIINLHFTIVQIFVIQPSGCKGNFNNLSIYLSPFPVFSCTVLLTN